MDTQLLIVILCVAVAVIYMFRRLRRASKNGGQCCGGCDNKQQNTRLCGYACTGTENDAPSQQKTGEEKKADAEK
jgi:hypothetical protein